MIEKVDFSFDSACKEIGIERRCIRPRTPERNEKVERSHRIGREKSYRTLKFFYFGDLAEQGARWMGKCSATKRRSLNLLFPNEAELEKQKKLIDGVGRSGAPGVSNVSHHLAASNAILNNGSNVYFETRYFVASFFFSFFFCLFLRVFESVLPYVFKKSTSSRNSSYSLIMGSTFPFSAPFPFRSFCSFLPRVSKSVVKNFLKKSSASKCSSYSSIMGSPFFVSAFSPG
ncbi:MAG: hypothetical protein ACI32C_06225 [Candidatus Enteromonas sp.]